MERKVSDVRRAYLRKANQRYQASDKGRENHRIRQRKYRRHKESDKRKRAAMVTDSLLKNNNVVT